MEEKTLKISKIKDGTVIDHIPSGKALRVLSILGIRDDVDYTVSVGMHVPSSKMEYKDVIKIENRSLDKNELDMISLTAPNATISIIKNYEISEKFKVELPPKLIGIIKCKNQNCITNTREPVKPEFEIVSRHPLVLRCVYCQRTMNERDVFE
ncbi:aspartate carbamoyl transferase regulatory subunit [Thermoplasma volcanium GSS1]|uniref:Aspartate carbamoyltransferase regulatory chain n=1 Tax=Thermoplasma volcanium (strain ATCC 51530 / DSM 4299 / JCM 9571 / NBRC 15438 / GSS1) TaxID=273116 RepID=PYRI_THEVO|nr:aspartate carbamoyltransferase regulatory subunit [Thermoplasma volcanium]Q97B28.1 RecName: Full=Aspartate carbamoyltransferase regulatory chain [Thermoplasma volcanium GSS1]BAB59773.1 aspartate carbamoyl transferase regulatory subunit [Thermoplasma volcanium GSS1]